MAEKLEWAGQFQIDKANILTSAGTILPIEKNIISIMRILQGKFSYSLNPILSITICSSIF